MTCYTKHTVWLSARVLTGQAGVAHHTNRVQKRLARQETEIKVVGVYGVAGSLVCCRYGVDNVTLKFVEPATDEPRLRIFNLHLKRASPAS